MYFSQTLIAAVALASSAMAAPARTMAVEAESWVMENMQRICDEADDVCTWTFRINMLTPGIPSTGVEYIVERAGDVPASRAIGGPSEFGIFTVTSTWSDFFGEDEAWTTMSVIDYERGVLVHPSYTDAQLAGGQVVEPDQAYTPEAISF